MTLPVLHIGYFYKKQLNLYGDNGNVEILEHRASQRGIKVKVHVIDLDTDIDTELANKINFVFMGGGPDSSQRDVYKDLLHNKRSFLKEYITRGGVGLYICGSYQLLGNYYLDSEGNKLEGLGIFDIYTQHFGKKKPRCIGNTTAVLNSKITEDPMFVKGDFGNEIVGFENHGGRTFLANAKNAFSKVIKGDGNNSTDGTEGYLYKNSIGTYFHGPLLSKNPHLADFLLAKSLNLDTLEPLDDSLILSAHTASKKLKK